MGGVAGGDGGIGHDSLAMSCLATQSNGLGVLVFGLDFFIFLHRCLLCTRYALPTPPHLCRLCGRGFCALVRLHSVAMPHRDLHQERCQDEASHPLPLRSPKAAPFASVSALRLPNTGRSCPRQGEVTLVPNLVAVRCFLLAGPEIQWWSEWRGYAVVAASRAARLRSISVDRSVSGQASTLQHRPGTLG
jgi:hypothetical protein